MLLHAVWETEAGVSGMGLWGLWHKQAFAAPWSKEASMLLSSGHQVASGEGGCKSSTQIIYPRLMRAFSSLLLICV